MAILEKEKIFLAVCETKSLTKASEMLSISVSSVSRALSSLETGLGQMLIERSSKAFALTQKGEVYFRAVSQAVKLLDNCHKQFKSNELREEIRINAFVSIGKMAVLPLVAEFIKRDPSLRFRVTLERKLNASEKHTHDLYIRYARPVDSSYCVKPLPDIEHYLYASKDYIAKNGQPKTPQDLVDHNVLRYDYYHSPQISLFNEKESHDLKIKSNFSGNGSESLKYATENGVGLGPLPSWFVAKDSDLVKVLP